MTLMINELGLIDLETLSFPYYLLTKTLRKPWVTLHKTVIDPEVCIESTEEIPRDPLVYTD